MIQVKVPGKLYIAGEYAVVEPGHPAILVAVNQCLTMQIEAHHHHTGVIHSDQYHDQDLDWQRENGFLHPLNEHHPFDYVLQAIQITEQFARSKRCHMLTYDINIASALDAQNGKKYGLGSSAAVVVATVKALCKLYQLPVSKLAIFKLAAIAHLTVQGNGSLGDVATSAYGGWIAYSSFNRDWLKRHLKSTPIETLIDQPWPELSIEALTPPEHLALLVGWTGNSASTSKMVNQMSVQNLRSNPRYQRFLMDSKECVEQIIKGFKNNDLSLIQSQIKVYRTLLSDLASLTRVVIETPRLKQLCQIAIQNHAVAKSSGAGGGDCGIVLLNDYFSAQPIFDEWKKHQITPLPFQVYRPIGV